MLCRSGRLARERFDQGLARVGSVINREVDGSSTEKLDRVLAILDARD
jgi:hypothetical protein